MNDDNADLLFAPEDDDSTGPSGLEARPWKVMIIDDDQGVHDVTKLALSNFVLDGRSLEFLHAYSGKEAIEILENTQDVAVALVDVVMESEHAGLDCIRYIREVMKNQMIRLVLRTGQPGQAPERKVILDYDINDYKEKSELTSQKLYSSILTSLRSYRDLSNLEANRNGLRRVISSSSEMFQPKMLQGFIQGVLEQLIAVLYLEKTMLYGQCDTLAIEHNDNEDGVKVIAATGAFESLIGKDARDTLPPDVISIIQEALIKKRMVAREKEYVGYFKPREGREDVIYLRSVMTLSDDDADLVKLFLQNVSIAYENTLLRDEIEGTQRDIVYMLGEAIESRSKETGNHVRRVAEYSFMIALGIGLTRAEAEILKVASPLHDFGKIAIPDAILHKPDKLTEDEFELMKTHAGIGMQLLSKSDRKILRAASIVAGEHHEKWDGSGYPLGLKGEDIHVFGRIVAVADVFDALGSRRSYKEPWPLERIVALLQEESGRHFDPTIVNWVLDNTDIMVEVRRMYPDADEYVH